MHSDQDSNKVIRLPERLRVVVTLAQLLERLEGSLRPEAADQYRSVVRHLGEELERLDADEALDVVLRSFPAAAEVYENLHYHQAGLCRSALEPSLNAEVQARVAIERAARREA
jgi:hypothetical protein